VLSIFMGFLSSSKFRDATLLGDGRFIPNIDPFNIRHPVFQCCNPKLVTASDNSARSADPSGVTVGCI